MASAPFDQWHGFGSKLLLGASGIIFTALLAYFIWLGTSVVRIDARTTSIEKSVASLVEARTVGTARQSDENTQRINELESGSTTRNPLIIDTKRTDRQTMALIGLPPLRYRGDINGAVHFASPEKVTVLCGGKVEGKILLGCARARPRQMYVANPCLSSDQLYARELCHELGHLNGWPADHGP